MNKKIVKVKVKIWHLLIEFVLMAIKWQLHILLQRLMRCWTLLPIEIWTVITYFFQTISSIRETFYADCRLVKPEKWAIFVWKNQTLLIIATIKDCSNLLILRNYYLEAHFHCTFSRNNLIYPFTLLRFRKFLALRIEFLHRLHFYHWFIHYSCFSKFKIVFFARA